MNRMIGRCGTTTLHVALLGLSLALPGTVLSEPVTVLLAEGGTSRFPVVVATGATARVHGAATNLAEHLTRITGASFAVQPGEGLAGLAVGLTGDFPKLPVTPDFHPQLPTGREDYLLQTHAGGVYLLGATELAVEHAVWDFLYRLGYRQFFPGPHWEIVPSRPRLEMALDTLQRPDYFARRLSGSTSLGKDAYGDGRAYRDWMARNRVAEGWVISDTHIYGFIITARKKEFEAHPEYLALVDGQRKGSKFCTANKDLRKLVVDFALEHFQKNPRSEAISMEPSDGGGHCECSDCAKLGSVSTRVVMLANEVAAAVNEVYPGKLVSILVYNFHTAPPDIQVHPQVAATICAGQLTGNWKPEELFDAWTAKGANAAGSGYGIFEYYSNIVGNRYLPMGTRASDLLYLQKTIPDFHRRGARRLVTGIAYSNGSVALGTYMASRMLWDVEEAGRLPELYKDFLEKCFGAARQPMDRFYRLVYRIDKADPKMPLTGDTVGRMYRALNEAWPLAADDAVRRRIEDLILYTRHVELHLAGRTVPAPADATGDFMRHAWRMRKEMMVDVYGLFEYLPQNIPAAEYGWRVPADKNPWKTGEPYKSDEIAAMLQAGVTNNRIGEYQTRSFSDDLVPAAGLLPPEKMPAAPIYGFGLPPEGRQVFYTWVDKAPGEVKLRATGGLIWPKRAGNLKITLFSDKAVSDAADFVVTTDHSVPPDQKEHLVVLRTPYAGMHRIEVENPNAAALVLPGEEGMVFTVRVGPVDCFNSRHIWGGWFYVPKGTKALSFHAGLAEGEILGGDGKPVFSFKRAITSPAGQVPPAKAAGYYSVEVPPGQDGGLWRLEAARSPWRLLNVPPWLARQPSELLLPREVVEADATGAGEARP